MLDIRISGATIVDGTGRPGRPGDLAVRDGRIVANDPHESANRTIVADGLVVAPGFIDIHTHYDAQLFWDPMVTPSCLHGVTTVIGGNCGFSLAPLAPESAGYLMRMMARVEGMPLPALEQGVPWEWQTFGDYLDLLEGHVGVNVGFLAGHSAIRRAVMGERSVGELARDDEIHRMVELLDTALHSGALGFSTSSAPSHTDGDRMPVPSRAASREEVLALATATGGHPGTTLETIPANGHYSDDVKDLLIDMSLAADRPVNWNVLVIGTVDPQIHVNRLETSDRAASRGACVTGLLYPDVAFLRLSFESGFLLETFPGWGDLFKLDRQDRLRELGRPEIRQRLVADAQGINPAGRRLVNWPKYRIGNSPTHPHLNGHLIESIAEERRASSFDALLDIVIGDNLRTGLDPPPDGDDDSSWRLRAQLCADSRTIVGGSDAGAHMDMMCGAVYTTRMLAEFQRRRLLPLEAVVNQLTDVPARYLGLRGRGRIANGWHADLVLFDADSVGAQPLDTRSDLPGPADRLFAGADGIASVIVNGREIVNDGEVVADLPGTVLRSGRDTSTVDNHAALRLLGMRDANGK